jgi:hypothetical protein
MTMVGRVSSVFRIKEMHHFPETVDEPEQRHILQSENESPPEGFRMIFRGHTLVPLFINVYRAG